MEYDVVIGLLRLGAWLLLGLGSWVLFCWGLNAFGEWRLRRAIRSDPYGWLDYFDAAERADEARRKRSKTDGI